MSHKEKLFDLLTEPDLPFSKRMLMLATVMNNPEATPEQVLESAIFTDTTTADRFNGMQGIYGNVWVRGHYYPKRGDTMETHTHAHHHQSLVAHGSVMAYIEGYEPKVYHAGEFISVHSGLEHSFVALEDDTTQFCVWAIRDEDGQVPELIDGLKLPFDPDEEGLRYAYGESRARERHVVIKKVKV